MTAALVSASILLALGWAETIHDWNWYSRPRQGWGQLQWRLLWLTLFTAMLAWGIWRHWS